MIRMTVRKARFSGEGKELYCFADTLALCDALLAAGARIIQLREKTLGDAAFLRLAGKMADRVRRYPGAVFIVNDRVAAIGGISLDNIRQVDGAGARRKLSPSRSLERFLSHADQGDRR
jgi:thiamine monophosphate synthase